MTKTLKKEGKQLQIYFTDVKDYDLISRAAKYKGLSRGGFLRLFALEEARKILSEMETLPDD